MANPSSVPGTVDPTVDPLSVIPKAHLGTALDAAKNRVKNGNSGQQDTQLLTALQQVIALLTGGGDEQREDVVMVNPHGRIIEVSGQYVDEWINKPGFRAATPEETDNYRKAMLRQTAEYLRRREAKRLADQKRLMDDLENDEDDSNVSTEDLMRAKVTDAQKTGALSPEQVSQLKRPDQTTNTPAPKDGETTTAPKDKTPPKRNGRRTPVKPKEPTSEDAGSDEGDSDGPSADDVEDV